MASVWVCQCRGLEHTPRLRPLQPAEPVPARWLDANQVLLALALAEFDCDPTERAGLVRARREVRQFKGGEAEPRFEG